MDKVTEKRIAAEKRWIRKLVKALVAAGWTVDVSYGGGDIVECNSVEDVMKAVHACDEEWLLPRHPSYGTSNVYLVYGNADDGSEVIADYGMKVDEIVKAIGYYDN